MIALNNEVQMKHFSILLLIFTITLVSCKKEEKKMEPQKNKIMVIGHRGASGYTPENTLASMKKAIELNAEMSELDVQETADGEIIVLHDGSPGQRLFCVEEDKLYFNEDIYERDAAVLKELDKPFGG